eukprot:g30302.t1
MQYSTGTNPVLRWCDDILNLQERRKCVLRKLEEELQLPMIRGPDLFFSQWLYEAHLTFAKFRVTMDHVFDVNFESYVPVFPIRVSMFGTELRTSWPVWEHLFFEVFQGSLEKKVGTSGNIALAVTHCTALEHNACIPPAEPPLDFDFEDYFAHSRDLTGDGSRLFFKLCTKIKTSRPMWRMHTMPGASRFYTAPEAARTASVDCGGETGPLMAWGDEDQLTNFKRVAEEHYQLMHEQLTKVEETYESQLDQWEESLNHQDAELNQLQLQLKNAEPAPGEDTQSLRSLMVGTTDISRPIVKKLIEGNQIKPGQLGAENQDELQARLMTAHYIQLYYKKENQQQVTEKETPQVVALSCIFLACKVLDFPKRMKMLIRAYNQVLAEKRAFASIAVSWDQSKKVMFTTASRFAVDAYCGNPELSRDMDVLTTASIVFASRYILRSKSTSSPAVVAALDRSWDQRTRCRTP